MQKKLKPAGKLSAGIMLHMFDSMIRPIMLYGSDVWGINNARTKDLDTLFLCFAKHCLGVKKSTCNMMIYGDSGRLPLSLQCINNVLKYYHRLMHMPKQKLARRVFDELNSLHEQGFTTWVTKANHLVHKHGIELNTTNYREFKHVCSEKLKAKYIETWQEELVDVAKNPLLRFYNTIKQNFGVEKYLYLSQYKYSNSIAKIRYSSHSLPIEKGRHLEIPLILRNCAVCGG